MRPRFQSAFLQRPCIEGRAVGGHHLEGHAVDHETRGFGRIVGEHQARGSSGPLIFETQGVTQDLSRVGPAVSIFVLHQGVDLGGDQHRLVVVDDGGGGLGRAELRVIHADDAHAEVSSDSSSYSARCDTFATTIQSLVQTPGEKTRVQEIGAPRPRSHRRGGDSALRGARRSIFCWARFSSRACSACSASCRASAACRSPAISRPPTSERSRDCGRRAPGCARKRCRRRWSVGSPGTSRQPTLAQSDLRAEVCAHQTSIGWPIMASYRAIRWSISM